MRAATPHTSKIRTLSFFLLDPDLYGCVCADDICQVDGTDQPDLDRYQLRYLGVCAGGGKAGEGTAEFGRGDRIDNIHKTVKTPAICVQANGL